MAYEKRLIDANALISDFAHSPVYNAREFASIKRRIKAAPTVDAVQVVRCKECKHWQYVEDGLGDCTNPRFHLPGHPDPTMEKDGFCSCRERGTE